LISTSIHPNKFAGTWFCGLIFFERVLYDELSVVASRRESELDHYLASPSGRSLNDVSRLDISDALIVCLLLMTSEVKRMSLNRNNTYNGGQQVVDGNHYDACKFENCLLVFKGGEYVVFTNCNFVNCRWIFADAAGRTVAFMKALYHGMGDGGKLIIDQVFKEITGP
jgi:hypothetical protein